MELKEIEALINDKLNSNREKIVISYYELKVKRNLENTELFGVLHIISEELEKRRYKTYRTGQKYTFNNKENIVESNELLVGIRWKYLYNWLIEHKKYIFANIEFDNKRL